MQTHYSMAVTNWYSILWILETDYWYGIFKVCVPNKEEVTYDISFDEVLLVARHISITKK